MFIFDSTVHSTMLIYVYTYTDVSLFGIDHEVT